MPDSEWTTLMGRALELARRAEGQTRPNPLVGAVIVRDGRILGEGWHRRAGQPHAEIEALRACHEDPRGATILVTLEPCNHHGRTPPCTEALLASGISRVVLAQRDPNLAARGGVERLRAAGIDVVCGVREAEAWMLNPAFNTFHLLGRPLVTLKWAMSADGCTSCAGGDSKWITGAAARRRVHEMRAQHDAVLVGIETALADGARLSVRDAELPPGPALRRIVLDSHLRLPPDHPLVQETQGRATVVCCETAPLGAEARLVNAGADVWRVGGPAESSRVAIPELMRRFRSEGVQSVFVEGGRRVAGALLASGVVDRVAAFVAPVLIATPGVALSPLVSLEGAAGSMASAVRLHDTKVSVLDADVLIEGWASSHLQTAAHPT